MCLSQCLQTVGRTIDIKFNDDGVYELQCDSLSLSLCPVNAQQKETEAIKLMTVRAGLLDMSRSWELMGKKCSLLAQSQQAS